MSLVKAENEMNEDRYSKVVHFVPPSKIPLQIILVTF